MDVILFPETHESVVTMHNTCAFKTSECFVLKPGKHTFNFNSDGISEHKFQTFEKLMNVKTLIAGSIQVVSKYIACNGQLYMDLLKIIYIPGNNEFEFELSHTGMIQVCRHFNFVPLNQMTKPKPVDTIMEYACVPFSLIVGDDEDRLHFLDQYNAAAPSPHA